MLEERLSYQIFCQSLHREIKRTKIKSVIALLFILCLQPIFSQAVSFDNADKYYEDALIHYQKKDFTTAIIQLKNALQLDNKHLPAKILLGEAYISSGEPEAAEVQLRRARQQGADEDLVAVPIGNSLLSQDKYQKLKDYISRTRRSPEVDSKLQVILGIAYTQQLKYREADQAFNKARSLDPGNPEPLLALGSLALNYGDLDTAQTLVDALRGLAPDRPDLWLLEGDLYLRQNKSELALEFYNRILQQNPEYVTATFRRARILLDKGQFDVVIAELKPLWEEELYDPEAIYLYSTALARSGNTALANKVLEDASRKIDYLGADLLDKHPTLTLLSATIAFDQGDYLKALESAKTLVGKLPDHTQSRMLLGRIYMDMEQPEDVIDSLKPIYYLQEKNPDFLSLYGRALLQMERYPEAIRQLERAAKLSNDPLSLLTDIALAKIAIGKTEKAVEELKAAIRKGEYDTESGVLLSYTQLSEDKKSEAESTALLFLKQDGENPVLYNLLGTIAASRDDVTEARHRFQQALKFDPNYVPARMNLIKFDMKAGNLVSAEEQLNKLLQDDPDSRQAMAGLAQVAEMKGNLESAALWLEKMWAKHPDILLGPLHLIDLYMELAQDDKALIVAQRLRDKYAKNFDVLMALINTQIAVGKRQDAIDAIIRSLRYTVDFTVTQLLEIAKKQIQLEDGNGAYSTLGRCLIQEPDFTPAKIELIRLETQLRNYDKALQLADQVIVDQSDSALGYNLKGDILESAGREEEAIKVYEKANAIWPSTELHLKVLKLGLSKDKNKQMLMPLEKWARNNPEDVEAQFGLAVAYIDVNEYDKSIKLHQALLKKLPNDASVHNNLAWLLQHKGDKNAFPHAKKAYELSPEDPAVLDTYGWVLSESGNFDVGLRYIRQALSRSSRDPAARYHLALIFSRLDRKDEARDTLIELLKNNQHFREIDQARSLLGQLEKQKP